MEIAVLDCHSEVVAERDVALSDHPNGLQHASNGVVWQPNAEWRIIDDPLQWILQYKTGDRWVNRSYCRTTEGMLRCIRDYCGEVGGLPALPEWHP
jgi:hypothetical protein